MQQLSEQDSAFLADDSGHANANVSLLHIYDQSTAPGGKVRFKTLLAHIESRLGRSPVFRRKLVQVPLGLDRPYWTEDEHFDLEYHVRHIALPKPGDWRQFCIQVSRIHARALDLARPLWEIYVIEGLDSFLDLPEGSFALMAKTHHAAVDFERDNEWTMLLHDLSPQPPAAAPPPPWFPGGPPHLLPLVARGLLRTLAAPGRAAAPLARRLRKAAPSGLMLAGEALLREGEMPAVRFNSVVSPHRVFETRRFALDEFDRIRSLVGAPGAGSGRRAARGGSSKVAPPHSPEKGATLDEAVLAVCGGALRRYLETHDELPAASLVALAPRHRERAGTGEMPDIDWRRVRLATDVADPVQRLREICAQRPAGRRGRAGPGAAAAQGDRGAALISRAAKVLAAALAGHRTPLANCTIAQVPGPSQPLYLCGARMTYFSAMLPIADGMALAFAVTSYDGKVIISPTSCRELMPDPEHFAQCLRDSFQELLARAPKTVPGRATAPERRTKAPAQPGQAASRR